jgi:2-polyprenyl-3-methyl-5-hydroxy-6-metoxy-1,4-benzoquinol methylase
MTMDNIKSFSRPFCTVCKSEGIEMYINLTDKLYGSSGKWNLMKCINKNCNTIWLNPAPVEEDIHKAYQNYYTHIDSTPKKKNILRKLFNRIQESYLSNKYGYSSSAPKYLKLFLFLTPLRRSAIDFKVMFLPETNGNLLDIGCGSGEFILFMQSKGWNVTGIDSDLKAVQRAQGKGLNVIKGNILDHNFLQESFDAIVLSHLIEHLHNPDKVLSMCKRLLKKGGKLVIATPNIESFGHLVFRQNWRGLEPPRHINLFSIRSLNNLISKLGFEETTIFTIPRIAADIFITSSQIKSGQKINIKSSVPQILKVIASVFAVFESFLNTFLFSIGEEIIVISKKDN